MQNMTIIKRRCMLQYQYQAQSTMERQFNTVELSQLPYQKLFQLAQQKFNELDYEQAQLYYQAAYRQKPHEDMIVLCYAHILKQNQKSQQAQNILKNSLNTNPNGSYKRYFELAQIYNAEDSIRVFQQGIQSALKCLSNPFLNIAPQSQIKRDIAQAYASIAQICMSDLSHIPYEQVQAKCIQVLQKGKKIDISCMDIHLQIANCLIEKDQYQQVQAQLLIIKQAYMQQKQQYEDQMVLQCAKYFMEISKYQHSIDVLEKLNQSQNNSAEVVYLLAFCAFQMNKYQLCKQYIADYPKDQQDDEEVDTAMKQLKAELNKKIKVSDDTEQGNNDDDNQQQWIDEEQQMDEQGM